MTFRPDQRYASGVRTGIFLAVLSVVTSLTVALPLRAESAVALPSCGTFTGPKWTAQGKTGRLYAFGAAALSCSSAKSFIEKMVGRPRAAAALAAPKSFQCVFTGASPTTSAGTCQVLIPAVLFDWAPKLT